MTEVKFSDFAWCSKHGYRVFSARAPDSINRLGACYATGGVAILVNQILAGVYNRPKVDPTHLLSTLEEWFLGCRPGVPCIAGGDWNVTPLNWDLLQGCFPGSEVAGVKDPLSGEFLPTRWEGHRAIDWLWSRAQKSRPCATLPSAFL